VSEFSLEVDMTTIALLRLATQWRVIKQEYQGCIAIYRISRIKNFDRINVAVQFIAPVIAVRFIAQNSRINPTATNPVRESFIIVFLNSVNSREYRG